MYTYYVFCAHLESRCSMGNLNAARPVKTLLLAKVTHIWLVREVRGISIEGQPEVEHRMSQLNHLEAPAFYLRFRHFGSTNFPPIKSIQKVLWSAKSWRT